jgi:hypothetical protein
MGAADGVVHHRIVGNGNRLRPRLVRPGQRLRRRLRRQLTAPPNRGGHPASSRAPAPVYVQGKHLFADGGGPTTNLALDEPVTASSDFQAYVPSNATDGNTSTYWESADGAGYPQTVTVNLGSVQSIGSITLDLPPSSSWSTRTETLSVLGSTNDTTFSQLVASAGYTFNPSIGNTETIGLPAGTNAGAWS